MEVEMIPVAEIIPYEQNPRKNDKAVDIVAKSIKEFGFKQPIVIDQNNVIIAGHTRLKAAQKLNIKEVPIVWADDLTPEQVKAYRIMDNKSHEYTEWDIDTLKTELTELKDLEYDLDLTGFTENELNDLLPNETKEEEFEIPKEPKYKIEQGEIWKLGNHRLMCGDATKKEDVDKLMDGQKADMVFTDPPYGVGYEEKSDRLGNKEHNKITGDENINSAKVIWKGAFQNIYDSLKEGGSYYLTAPQGGDQMMMMMMEGNIKCKHELIWVKPTPVFSMGRLDYDYQHEPILYGWKGTHEFIGAGKFKKSIWEIGRDSGKLHPTMKPVELISNSLLNSSKSKEIIMDVFGGSGTTLIACEQLNRKCFMMEIDPYYCSVIIERWEKLTGNKGEKLK